MTPFEDAPEARRTVEAVYRAESRRVLATLIRLLVALHAHGHGSFHAGWHNA